MNAHQRRIKRRTRRRSFVARLEAFKQKAQLSMTAALDDLFAHHKEGFRRWSEKNSQAYHP